MTDEEKADAIVKAMTTIDTLMDTTPKPHHDRELILARVKRSHAPRSLTALSADTPVERS